MMLKCLELPPRDRESVFAEYIFSPLPGSDWFCLPACLYFLLARLWGSGGSES